MTEENTIVRAGTKIVIRAQCGVGTDTCAFFMVNSDITEKELNDYAWEFGIDHASSYGIYNANEYSDEEIAEDEDSYSSDIEGYWELYNPEEHNGLRVGNDTSFQEI